MVAGALVKATVAALLPFMILSRRTLAPILGALAALALAAVVGYAVFGIHGIDLVAALNRDAAFVSTDSFPTELAHLVGKPGVFPIDHDLLKAGLVLIVLYLLWRTWRGYDWVAASGWTLLAISVTSTWLLPWYTLWSLPLAVVVRDRRLLAATLRDPGAVHRPPDGASAGACRMSDAAMIDARSTSRSRRADRRRPLEVACPSGCSRAIASCRARAAAG